MKKQPYGENRTEYIGLRVTSDEKSRIFEYAKMAGVTVTAYILGLALGEKIGDSIVEKKSRRQSSH